MRLKFLLKLFAVNGLLLAIGLVAIELLFGGWLNPGHLNRLNLLKDCEYEYDVSNLYDTSNPLIKYSRDEFGLRGTHRGPAEIDILTVGGSTTDQRYIRDGDTWQDVLQGRFESQGESVVVANAGVDGQSTYGHIMDFRWWFPFIPDLKPGYFLYFVGLNDFYKEAGHNDDQLLNGSKGFSLRRELGEKSALWHMVRTLRGVYKAMGIGHRSVDFREVGWTREALQTDYDFMRTRLDEYAERLRMLADLSREFGGEPIFVTQPSRQYRIGPDGLEGISRVSSYDGHQYNGVDFYYMMRKLDGITEAVAAEKQSIFVDLARDEGWADDDFYDFAHMTPHGAEKIGILLHNALRSSIGGIE